MKQMNYKEVDGVRAQKCGQKHRTRGGGKARVSREVDGRDHERTGHAKDSVVTIQ